VIGIGRRHADEFALQQLEMIGAAIQALEFREAHQRRGCHHFSSYLRPIGYNGASAIANCGNSACGAG
jgi:hypothetical protein